MKHEKLIKLLNENQLVALYESETQGQMAKTFQCSLMWDGANSSRSFIKFFNNCDSLGLVNEVTGYILAKHSGLPVPDKAGLIKINLENYPELPDCNPVAFVMTAAPGTTPVSYYNDEAMEYCKRLIDLVAQWAKISETLAFDDWLANEDRNIGNLLVTNSGDVTLIDHSNLPITLNWNASQLDPNHSAVSKLAKAIGYFKSTPFPVKAKISQSAQKHQTYLQHASTELEFWWEAFLSNDSARLKALKKFVEIRALNGHSRISGHYGMLVV
jgi:hypothetical protein